MFTSKNLLQQEFKSVIKKLVKRHRQYQYHDDIRAKRRRSRAIKQRFLVTIKRVNTSNRQLCETVNIN